MELKDNTKDISPWTTAVFFQTQEQIHSALRMKSKNFRFIKYMNSSKINFNYENIMKHCLHSIGFIHNACVFFLQAMKAGIVHEKSAFLSASLVRNILEL